MDLTLTAKEIERFWQLYVADCERSGTKPDSGDFALWIREELE